MTSLQSSITRLSLFRGSFPDGQICEETGLSTDDLDAVLGLPAKIFEVIDARTAVYEHKADKADGLAPDDCNRFDRMKQHADAMRWLRAEMEQVVGVIPADPGIPIYASRDATDEVIGLTTCTTCGQSFSLNDAEAVAWHDQEMHDPRQVL